MAFIDSRNFKTSSDVRFDRRLKRLVKKIENIHKKELTPDYRKKTLKKFAKVFKSAEQEKLTPAKGIWPWKHTRRSASGSIVTYDRGNLQKSIKVLPWRRTEAVFVGPQVGASKRYDGYYANFVEFGTNPYTYKNNNPKKIRGRSGMSFTLYKGVKLRGQKGQGFARKAFDENAERVGKAISQTFLRKIANSLKKF